MSKIFFRSNICEIKFIFLRISLQKKSSKLESTFNAEALLKRKQNYFSS